MKKKYLLILILILTVGFASINTVLDLKGNVSIGFKEDDFNVIISKVIMDEVDVSNNISEDKQSFTFTGTGSNKIEYTITNKSYQYDANVNLVCEPNNDLLINQVGEVVAQSRKSATIESNSTGVITCRMDIDKISKTEIAEDMCEYDVGQTWEFNYTGSEQEFTVPCDGDYKIELWGAQGNNHNMYVGGAGAYVSGMLSFNENKNIYLYIGEQPNGREGGYNGGGAGGAGDIRQNFIINNDGGGGATDIRLVNGTWDDFNSLKSRIMVASGGSGAVGDTKYSYPLTNGNAGGGLTSDTKIYSGPNITVYMATQVAGGYSSVHNGSNLNLNDVGGFGYGGSGFRSCSLERGCMLVSSGGGGGYYGGGAGGDYNAAGTGGSSFISGHDGCDAITESSTSSNIIHTGQPNHYSGYVFTNTVMIDGTGYKWTNVKGEYVGMPTHDGLSTMTGNTGHGYAKITYLG